MTWGWYRTEREWETEMMDRRPVTEAEVNWERFHAERMDLEIDWWMEEYLMRQEDLDMKAREGGP